MMNLGEIKNKEAIERFARRLVGEHYVAHRVMVCDTGCYMRVTYWRDGALTFTDVNVTNGNPYKGRLRPMLREEGGFKDTLEAVMVLVILVLIPPAVIFWLKAFAEWPRPWG